MQASVIKPVERVKNIFRTPASRLGGKFARGNDARQQRAGLILERVQRGFQKIRAALSIIRAVGDDQHLLLLLHRERQAEMIVVFKRVGGQPHLAEMHARARRRKPAR